MSTRHAGTQTTQLSNGSFIDEQEKNRLLGFNTFLRTRVGEFEKGHGCAFGYLKDLAWNLGSSFVITGSAVALSVIGKFEQASDIDIYASNADVFERGWNRLTLDNPIPGVTYSPDCSPSNPVSVITFSPFAAMASNTPFKVLPIQLIRLFWWHSGFEVLSSFDLSLNQIGLCKGEVIYDTLGLQDLKNQEIRLSKSVHFKSTLERIQKYKRRGFSVDLQKLGIEEGTWLSTVNNSPSNTSFVPNPQSVKYRESGVSYEQASDKQGWESLEKKAEYYGYSSYEEMVRALRLDE